MHALLRARYAQIPEARIRERDASKGGKPLTQATGPLSPTLRDPAINPAPRGLMHGTLRVMSAPGLQQARARPRAIHRDRAGRPGALAARRGVRRTAATGGHSPRSDRRSQPAASQRADPQPGQRGRPQHHSGACPRTAERRRPKAMPTTSPGWRYRASWTPKRRRGPVSNRRWWQGHRQQACHRPVTRQPAHVASAAWKRRGPSTAT